MDHRCDENTATLSFIIDQSNAKKTYEKAEVETTIDEMEMDS